MRFFAVLLAVVAVGFASGPCLISGHSSGFGYPLPEFDDVLDTYAYTTGDVLSSIPASFGDYAAVDDYTAATDADAVLSTYTCWGVSTATAPTALELFVVADSSSTPSGAPISQTSFTALSSTTGFTFGSYPVLLYVLDLSSDTISVAPGATVWLGAHRNDGSNWYPLCGTTVTGSEAYRTTAAGWSWASFSSTSIPAGDIFKIIEGSPASSSLNRSTWAGIKNMF
jgi:hypothetical protein